MNRTKSDPRFDIITRHPMGTDVVAATLVNTETDRAEQIRQAADCFGITQTAWLNQVHSGIVRVTEDALQNGTDGDAMMCRTPGILLGVFTADCVPMLVKGKTEIGVIHAGWRGFAANISVHFFDHWQTEPEHTSVLIGPCICAGCYEVGAEVAARFRPEERITIPGENPHLDLRLAARNRLMDAGILPAHIRTDTRCTACCPDLYSYRKDKTGYRNLSVIGLLPVGDNR